eukprot:1151915-Pelagomonas_calceolata.AAC.4
MPCARWVPAQLGMEAWNFYQVAIYPSSDTPSQIAGIATAADAARTLGSSTSQVVKSMALILAGHAAGQAPSTGACSSSGGGGSGTCAPFFGTSQSASCNHQAAALMPGDWLQGSPQRQGQEQACKLATPLHAHHCLSPQQEQEQQQQADLPRSSERTHTTPHETQGWLLGVSGDALRAPAAAAAAAPADVAAADDDAGAGAGADAAVSPSCLLAVLQGDRRLDLHKVRQASIVMELTQAWVATGAVSPLRGRSLLGRWASSVASLVCAQIGRTAGFGRSGGLRSAGRSSRREVTPPNPRSISVCSALTAHAPATRRGRSLPLQACLNGSSRLSLPPLQRHVLPKPHPLRRAHLPPAPVSRLQAGRGCSSHSSKAAAAAKATGSANRSLGCVALLRTALCCFDLLCFASLCFALLQRQPKP